MSGVEFFEESSQQIRTQSNQQFGQSKLPLFTRLLLKTGLVTTPESANYVLIALALVFFIAAALVFYIDVFHGSLIPAPPPPSHILLGGQKGIRGRPTMPVSTTVSTTTNALLY